MELVELLLKHFLLIFGSCQPAKSTLVYIYYSSTSWLGRGRNIVSLQRSAPHLIEALGDEGLALYFAAKIDRLLLNYYSGTVTSQGFWMQYSTSAQDIEKSDSLV